MKKTYLEFFAGGGMAHAGLGKDWSCLFANDFDLKKAQVYASNWGGKCLHVGDIAKVTAEQIPERSDLAWASFPCQDLSLAGNGAGLAGARSGTFWPFVNLMRQLKKQGRQPRVIALENVAGAITSHDGADFEAMIEAFQSMGYQVGAMIVDAIHFLPQSRPRLFIIAADDAIEIPSQCKSESPSPAWHPASIIKAYNKLKPLSKLKWIWWDMPMPKRRLQTLDEIIEKVPQGVDWHSKEETQKLLGMMSPLNKRKVLEAQGDGRLKVGTIYRRTREGMQRAEVRFDGVAGCLRTPGGGSSRQTILIVNGPNIHSRLLSPREAARLMGLKDTYKLPARYNDAYHLAGDGVVVPVVNHLSKYLFNRIIENNLSVQYIKRAA